jgi:DNA-binding MarR family transcriptional regulator
MCPISAQTSAKINGKRKARDGFSVDFKGSKITEARAKFTTRMQSRDDVMPHPKPYAVQQMPTVFRTCAVLAPNGLTCFADAMTEPTQDQVDQLTRAFARFTRRFKVAEAAAAADNALNALDAETLVFVGDNPACGIGDVARYLNVAMTTMSSAIDRLVKKELIDRRRPEDDRRSVALKATAKGRRAIQDHVAGYREACRAMLRSLDPGEQRELIRLSEKIAGSES